MILPLPDAAPATALISHPSSAEIVAIAPAVAVQVQPLPNKVRQSLKGSLSKDTHLTTEDAAAKTSNRGTAASSIEALFEAACKENINDKK